MGGMHVNNEPEAVANAITELAEFASMGRETWHAFNHEFNKLYPGSITNITVFDRRSLIPVLVATSDIDPVLEHEYVQYYGAINPWNEFWPKAAAGKPYASTKYQPSSLFRTTEFYNDWLLKTGTIDCVGMKLLTSDREIISFSTMLPNSRLEENELHALELFDNIASAVTKGVENSQLFAKLGSQDVGSAAVVDRSPDIALVVDHALKVIAANEQAEHAMRSEDLIFARSGRLHIVEGEIAAWFKAAFADLLMNRPINDNKRLGRHRGRYLQINLNRLPYSGTASVPSRMLKPFLLLIVIKELSAAAPLISAKILADLFHLTEGEASICVMLREGLTVNEIADQRNLSRETVRHHLKAIFRKSGTSRQAELVALLQRLR
jgi:DNA-binding CsgD family transcriptional regulator